MIDYWNGSAPMWGSWGHWWFFPLFMMFTMAICIAFFFFMLRVGARYWGLAFGTRPSSMADPTVSAVRILNERFARGEIERAEYEEKKAIVLASRLT